MQHKIALITGASRGLGRSMALHLAAQGVSVIGTYKRSADEAAAVARAVESHGQKSVMLPLDVARTDTFAAFADTIAMTLQSVFGRSTFDMLVNNAGTGQYGSVEATTEEIFDAMVAEHLKAPFFLTQRLLPHMSDGGRILNVSTGLTRFTYPGRAAYASVKGAVEVLTRYQAQELGPRGIRVNVIAPGATATDFGGGVLRDNPEVNRHVTETIPLGRVGLPDDIGAAAAAMLSDAMHWMNGVRVEVSGGQHL